MVVLPDDAAGTRALLRAAPPSRAWFALRLSVLWRTNVVFWHALFAKVRKDAYGVGTTKSNVRTTKRQATDLQPGEGRRTLPPSAEGEGVCPFTPSLLHRPFAAPLYAATAAHARYAKFIVGGPIELALSKKRLRGNTH